MLAQTILLTNNNDFQTGLKLDCLHISLATLNAHNAIYKPLIIQQRSVSIHNVCKTNLTVRGIAENIAKNATIYCIIKTENFVPRVRDK